MRRTTSLLFLAINLLFCNCNKSPKEHSGNPPLIKKETLPQKGKIVLILKNRKVSSNFIKGTAIPVKIILPDILVSDNNKEVELNVDEIKKDTLTFNINGTYALIRARHNAVGFFDFLVKQGDTLQIAFLDGVPQATHLNRKVTDYELNYDQYLNKEQSLDPKEYSNLEKYFYPEIGIKSATGNYLNEMQSFKKEMRLAVIPLLSKEKFYLDSLKEENLISSSSYAFYKDRLTHYQHQIDLSENKLTTAEVKIIVSHLNNSQFNGITFYNKAFVQAVAGKFYVAKANTLEMGNGKLIDFRQIYDSINNTTYIPKPYKEGLLFEQLNKISENFSNKDFITYYTKFLVSVKDSARLSQVKSHFANALNTKVNDAKFTHLQSNNKEELSLEKLIKQHAGKVMYVDFWASWCAPCRAAMPESFALKEAMKGKDVIFVYLSLDKQPKPWQAASVKEGLAAYKENYLILNPDNADFLRAQKVRMIPRYMIFDKKGELAFANAPGPKSKDLKAMLLELSSK